MSRLTDSSAPFQPMELALVAKSLDLLLCRWILPVAF
jgi:hypothetical protein